MSQFPSNAKPTQAEPAGSGQLVLVGFVIAIIAVVLMNVYVEMRVAAEEEQTITFFKFKDDMKIGEEIEAKDLTPVRIPKSMAMAFGTGAIREDPKSPGRPGDGLGFKLNAPAIAEQLLTSNLFIGSGSTRVRDPQYRDLDEITLNIDSKEQPPNLRPGDFVDLYASIPLNRDTSYMRVMEYVKVVDLGDRIQDAGATRGKANKYGSITIYVDPKLSSKLFDIQKRVDGRTFNVTRRDPQDKTPRELKTGGSKEINQRVLTIFNLD